MEQYISKKTQMAVNILENFRPNRGFIDSTAIKEMILENYKNKKYIKENFLNGEDKRKIKFKTKKVNEVDIAKKIKDDIKQIVNKNKDKDSLKLSLLKDISYLSTENLIKIVKNKSDIKFLSTIFFHLSNHLSKPGNVHEKINIVNGLISLNQKNLSPKLTKAINSIVKECFPNKEKQSKLVSNIVTDVISIITAYKPMIDKEEEIELVISVDPLDFITASVNDMGWKSCFHITSEEFASAMATMMDKFTFVIYNPSKKSKMVFYDESNNKIFWNNKRIRAFGHFDTEMESFLINNFYPKNVFSTDFSSDVGDVIAEQIGFKRYKNKQPGIYLETADTFLYNDLADRNLSDFSIWSANGEAYDIEVGSLNVRCIQCGVKLEYTIEEYDDTSFCGCRCASCLSDMEGEEY